MTRVNHRENIRSGQTKRRPSFARRVRKGKQFWEKRERAQAREAEVRRQLEVEKEEAIRKLREERRRFKEFKQVKTLASISNKF